MRVLSSAQAGYSTRARAAAAIDGATVWQTFWRVVLPIATPALIVLTILSTQGSWNEFLHPLIAAPAAPELRPLPVGLALLRGVFGEAQPWNAIMAGTFHDHPDGRDLLRLPAVLQPGRGRVSSEALRL